jgi:hypothetical protein
MVQVLKQIRPKLFLRDPIQIAREITQIQDPFQASIRGSANVNPDILPNVVFSVV